MQPVRMHAHTVTNVLTDAAEGPDELLSHIMHSNGLRCRCRQTIETVTFVVASARQPPTKYYRQISGNIIIKAEALPGCAATCARRFVRAASHLRAATYGAIITLSAVSIVRRARGTQCAENRFCHDHDHQLQPPPTPHNSECELHSCSTRCKKQSNSATRAHSPSLPPLPLPLPRVPDAYMFHSWIVCARGRRRNSVRARVYASPREFH